jgi:hypothetical protein
VRENGNREQGTGNRGSEEFLFPVPGARFPLELTFTTTSQ